MCNDVYQQSPGRPLTELLFFIQLYRWFLSILKAMTIIQPETLVRWEFSGGIKTLGSSIGDCGVGKAARRGTTRPFLRARKFNWAASIASLYGITAEQNPP